MIMTKTIPGGVVHKMPSDFRTAILSKPKVRALWEDLTPLSRNEWICWVEDAKKDETRERRIKVGISKMTSGMRRPCCWAGCTHRARTGKA